MTDVGADMLVAHVGLTTSGNIGAAVALTLDEAIARVLTIARAGPTVRDDILVMCHGGPFDEPDVVQQGLSRLPSINGFFGASSIERLPTERAICSQVASFKSMKVTTQHVGNRPRDVGV